MKPRPGLAGSTSSYPFSLVPHSLSGVEEQTGADKVYPLSGLHGRSELAELVRAWRAGQITPVPVKLGELPPDASDGMRVITKHMELLFGLRFAVDDDRPLPYAYSMAVAAGVRSRPAAQRALARMVAAGVVVDAGELKPLPGRQYGTRLYAPPPV
jgi:hypothetical protein